MDNKKITAMRHAGEILGDVLSDLVEAVVPGISELEIDELAEKLILEKGGKPGFKKVPGYKHTICISVNDVVVHGIPTNRIINEGDIVGIDCGVYYDGYHTDMAETVRAVSDKKSVRKSDTDIPGVNKIDNFLAVGKKSLFNAIKQAKTGNFVGQISEQMQKGVEGANYSIVQNLVGHGVGKNLHEAPEIPGYLAGKIEKTPKLTEGQTIAIEVIYNMGRPEVVYNGEDDWTIVTEDGSLSGLFERTVLVTKNGPELITKLRGDKI